MHPPAERPNLPHHVAQAFSTSLDLDKVISQIADQAIAAAHADRGFLMLRDSNGCLQPRAVRGISLATFDSPDFQTPRDLASRVAEEGTARTIGRDAQNPSLLCVPLQFEQGVVGVLAVERLEHHPPFALDDLELLNALAQQAAAAIENARLYCDAQAKLKNLHLLQEISTDLTSTLDLERVLTTCLLRVQDVLQVETATFLFREGDELVFQIAIGETADRIKPFRLKMGQGITGSVAQNARGDFTNDVQNDPRYYRTVDTELHFITRSLIAVPLILNGRVIGVISATNKPDGFTAADLDLLTTIAGSAAIAIENARLYQVAVEKGRLEHELQVARQVQSSLIPRDTPRFNGWDIAGMWEPAREVSGDYYDFIAAPHQFDLILADVSDKGMPAALLMAHTRSIVRASLSPTRSLAHGVTKANGLICANAPNDMFVTMCCVRLDSRSGKIICVNAGHNRPLIYRARQNDLVELTRTGIALGVLELSRFRQRVERLHRGDFILLYTDGVTDASNSQGESFGEERLRQIILENRRGKAEEIIAALERALKEFIGSAAPADDMTVVVAKKL